MVRGEQIKTARHSSDRTGQGDADAQPAIDEGRSDPGLRAEDPVLIASTGSRAKDKGNTGQPADGDASAAWDQCAEDVWKHENALVEKWKEDINYLLLFVRVFY